MYRALVLLTVVVTFMIVGFMNYADYLEKQLDTLPQCIEVKDFKSEPYYHLNIKGEKTLLLTTLPEVEKKEIWNASTLKEDMMNFFPNFMKMSTFVNDRVVDDGLFKKRLLAIIKNTEEEYIAGVINGQSAKETLSMF